MKYDDNCSTFPSRFYAMLMIGVGFISLGIMLFMLLDKVPASTRTFQLFLSR